MFMYSCGPVHRCLASLHEYEVCISVRVRLWEAGSRGDTKSVTFSIAALRSKWSTAVYASGDSRRAAAGTGSPAGRCSSEPCRRNVRIVGAGWPTRSTPRQALLHTQFSACTAYAVAPSALPRPAPDPPLVYAGGRHTRTRGHTIRRVPRGRGCHRSHGESLRTMQHLSCAEWRDGFPEPKPRCGSSRATARGRGGEAV